MPFRYSGRDIPSDGIMHAEGETEMAEAIEKAKKAKAPAKPRATPVAKKTTAKKQTVAEKVKATTPNHEEIAELARRYWAERGHQDGQAEQDWLRAEQELLKIAS
jgi:hydroxyethylthiazole kinase-like sugar kinase family protein